VDRLRLRVRDASTLRDLDQILLVRCKEDWTSAETIYPGSYGPEDVVLANGVSPLDMVPPRGDDDDEIDFEVEYWVTARGHAWNRIYVDFATESERHLLLEPAANLIVNVIGELPSARTPARDIGGSSTRFLDVDEHRVPMLRLRKAGKPQESFAQALSKYDELEAHEFPAGVKPSREEFERMLQDFVEQHRGIDISRGEVFAERAAAIGEIRFDRLPPGDLVAAIEVGDDSRPLVAGEVSATLIVGTETRIDILSAPPSPAPDPVPVAGTLYVPSGWPLEALSLEVSPVNLKGASDEDEVEIDVDAMCEDPTRSALYQWNAGKLKPARYRFFVSDTGFSRLIDIGPSGDQTVELNLAEPAMLLIQCIDEATGKPVPIREFEGSILWFTGNGLLGESVPLEIEALDEAVACRGVVPVGPGWLLIHHKSWDVAEPQRYEARAGQQELRIVVRRACGVIVGLACEGEPLPWPEETSFELEIEAVGHSGSGGMSSYGWCQNPRLQVSSKGRYRLKVPTIPGFAPVDPVEVEIPESRFLELTVELRPLR